MSFHHRSSEDCRSWRSVADVSVTLLGLHNCITPTVLIPHHASVFTCCSCRPCQRIRISPTRASQCPCQTRPVAKTVRRHLTGARIHRALVGVSHWALSCSKWLSRPIQAHPTRLRMSQSLRRSGRRGEMEGHTGSGESAAAQIENNRRPIPPCSVPRYQTLPLPAPSTWRIKTRSFSSLWLLPMAKSHLNTGSSMPQ